MVLPGIQALFGFQLVAVFNQSFWDKVAYQEQILHFAAIGLVALSVALVMTPAAYHRQAEPETISQRFIDLSTKLLSWSMFPLMLAIACEFYIIGVLVFRSRQGSILLAAVLLAVFSTLWFILPRVPAFQRLICSLR